MVGCMRVFAILRRILSGHITPVPKHPRFNIAAAAWKVRAERKQLPTVRRPLVLPGPEASTASPVGGSVTRRGMPPSSWAVNSFPQVKF